MATFAPIFAGIGGFFKAAMPVISTIGTVLGGIGILSSFRNTQQAGQFASMDRIQSANLFDISSLNTGVQGLQEKVNIKADEARRQAMIRAKYAARGIMADGSPETVMYDSLTQSRRLEQAAQFNYDSAAADQAMRGRMMKDQARSARAQGLSTAYADALSSTGALLQSVHRG